MISTHDMDAHAAAQSDWGLAYEQLSPGLFEGQIEQVQLPELMLLRESTSVALRQRGRLRPHVYGFAMAQSASSDVFFNGQRVQADAIMCGKGDEIDLTTPPHFTLIAVVVEDSLLNPLWESMYQKPLAKWLDKQLVLNAAPEKAQILRRLHVAALEKWRAHELTDARALRQLRDDILIEWIEALPAYVDTSDLPNLERRKNLVNQSCELMLAHADDPPTILAICQQVGISRRKLNYAFQDVLGTTPVKYLRALRLNNVRRAILRANDGQTIGDIAALWGFWHLGQFAQDYKNLFGELPSDSLKKIVNR